VQAAGLAAPAPRAARLRACRPWRSSPPCSAR
jgi:hypothetical protein